MCLRALDRETTMPRLPGAWDPLPFLLVLLALNTGCRARESVAAVPGDLRDLFWKDAEAVLRAHDTGLDDGAARRLHQIIDHGAAEMANRPQPPSAEEVAKAEQALRGIVARAVDEAAKDRVANSKGTEEVREGYLVKVQKWVCPLWPFC
jgi:hypothetical protein